MTDNDRRPYGFVTWGKVLRYIYENTQEQGFPPTYAEMKDAMGVNSTSTIAHHVDILIARKLVSRKPGSPRTLQVTETGRNILTRKGEKVPGHEETAAPGSQDTGTVLPDLVPG